MAQLKEYIDANLGKYKTIHLLGDAPNLQKFKKYTRSTNDLLIGVNCSFEKIMPNIHFFACKKFVDLHSKKFNKSLVSVHPKQFGMYGFYQEFTYNPVWDIENIPTSRLSCGHSVIIPATHFACLLRPERVILWGVEMLNWSHWYDGESKTTRFPGSKCACREMRKITKIFPKVKIEISCARTLFAKRRILGVMA